MFLEARGTKCFPSSVARNCNRSPAQVVVVVVLVVDRFYILYFSTKSTEGVSIVAWNQVLTLGLINLTRLQDHGPFVMCYVTAVHQTPRVGVVLTWGHRDV